MPARAPSAEAYVREVYIAAAILRLIDMASLKCPVCGVSVKAENLERHLKNQHPREKVDLSEVLSDADRETLEEERSTARPGLTAGGKRLIAIVAVVVAVLVALAILYPLLLPPKPMNTEFTLVSTDGTTVSTVAWRGSPVLVEFIDLDCPYCQEEAPVLISLYTSTVYDFTSRGVKFVSIDMNFEGTPDTADRINTWRTTTSYTCPQTGTACYYGSSWPYCLDPGGTVAGNFGVSQTPTVVIVNKDGSVAQKYVGVNQASATNIVAALNTALGG